ncbi:MAG: XrtA system polysaccharide chain length determinant [Tistlia sp.]|uniref:XrtA system polysaccharide chain length determinant n=1 Tax=Tistlia sp. TaxID=3057121 RepID=UPI0034A318AD
MSQLVRLLRFYAYGLWDRRWTIAVVAWVVCLGGWLWVASMPNRYTSTAQIYIDTQSLLGPLMEGLAVRQDIEAQVDVVRRTLLSRPNMQELAQVTDLDLRADTPAQLDRLLESLSQNIQLQTQGPALFRISYNSTSPELSQRVVSALLNIFVERNLGASQSDADKAERFINEQIARHERELREAEQAVAEFQRQHAGELGGSDRALRQIDVQTTVVQRLQEELSSLNWSRNQLRMQLAETPEFTTSTTAGGSSPKQRQLSQLRDELNALLLTYTERHPDVISKQNLINRLQSEVGSGGRGSSTTQAPNPEYEALASELRRVEGQIQATETRIGNAQARMEDLETLIEQTPEAQAQLTQLTRDYDTTRRNYETLISRRESARMARDMKVETSAVEFRVVEPPIVPATPSGPPHGLYMTAVLFAGLGAGIALALLRLQLAGGFQTSDALARSFGLPVLGSVSKIRSRSLPGTMVQGSAFVSSVLALLLVFGGVLYLYQFSDDQPDVRSLLSGLNGSLMEQGRRLL